MLSTDLKEGGCQLEQIPTMQEIETIEFTH